MALRRSKRTHRYPFRGVVDTVNEVNRIADRMTGIDGESVMPAQPRRHSDAWSPTTDILAKDTELVIRCDLPGVDPEDVDVSLSRGTLTIAGTRSTEDEDEDFLVRERTSGRFRRDITLPEGVQEDDVQASFIDGVLHVTVRDSAGAAGPARIDVRTEDN